MKVVLQILMMIFPWVIRRRMLCLVFGYRINPTARIGLSLIMPKQLDMGAKCKIGHFCVCRGIDRLSMGDGSGMGSFHLITGVSSLNKNHFNHIENRKCEMIIGKCVGIPSRKFFDCNGGIYIGDYTTVAGQWTQFLTHAIDIYESRQDAKPIRIGKYCFIGTGCILLPGASLPDYCVLGAGAVLNKQMSESGAIYAGVPAELKKRINPKNVPWMNRDTLGVL
jgi:acetyltransferase-like isoleucine patch superfamily enzyme